jgi:hypothetical protein
MSDDLVKRLRASLSMLAQEEAADRIEELEAKLDWVITERDETFALMLDRVQTAEAKLAKAVDVIDWALICWDDHNKHGYTMQGDWVSDARTTLAELKGEADAT